MTTFELYTDNHTEHSVDAGGEMAKKSVGLSSALESFLETEAGKEVALSKSAITETGSGRRGQTLQVLLPRSCAQALRLELKYLALERQTTQGELMLEALRDILVKYGKRPPVC